MTATAIETIYQGYRFRSRLEARWAVYFDQLGHTWEYEPEGLHLDGVRYLPDFRVDGDWWEIKAPAVLDEVWSLTRGDELTGATDTPTGPTSGWELLAKPVLLARDTRGQVHVRGGINHGDLALKLYFHKGDVYAEWWRLDDSPALEAARSRRFDR